MRKVKVAATIIVEVEVPADCDPLFVIEENNCPGSGPVLPAIQAAIAAAAASAVCLGCAKGWTNKYLGEVP